MLMVWLPAQLGPARQYHTTWPGCMFAQTLPLIGMMLPARHCRPGGSPHLARPPHHLCAPEQVCDYQCGPWSMNNGSTTKARLC